MGNPILDTFFEETEELLESLTEGLVSMQGAAYNKETVNSVFRAVHSIKGGAGAFKLTDLVNFAHSFETVLDAVRSETLALTPQIMHTLMRSTDCLADLVDAARSGRTIPKDVTDGFLTALQFCIGEDAIEAVDAWDNFEFAAIQLDIEPLDLPHSVAVPAVPQPVKVGYQIDFRPHAALYANGHEPALLFAALTSLGQIVTRIDLSRLPDWDDFDPFEPCLGWSLDLHTEAGEIAVHEVFEFVHGLCDLTLKPLMEGATELLREEAASPVFLSELIFPEAGELAPVIVQPAAVLSVATPKTKADHGEGGSDAQSPNTPLK